MGFSRQQRRCLGPRGNIGRVCRELNRYHFRHICEVQPPDTGYESHVFIRVVKTRFDAEAASSRHPDQERVSPREVREFEGHTWFVTETLSRGSDYGYRTDVDWERVPRIYKTYFTDRGHGLLLTAQLGASGRPEYEGTLPNLRARRGADPLGIAEAAAMGPKAVSGFGSWGRSPRSW